MKGSQRISGHYWSTRLQPVNRRETHRPGEAASRSWDGFVADSPLKEMDSNFRFGASSDYAGVGVLRSTWAV
jgi:hypothetical protein